MSTASNTPHPVIVVPGITATDMQDDYPLPPEQVWTTKIRREYDRLAIYPPRPPFSLDRLYEVREPALVRPGGPFPLVYKEMVEELREELDPGGKIYTPVYPFSYDWRQPLEVTARALQEFISEVIQRTKIMPAYRESNTKVNVVGHSMGGLVIAGALTLPSENGDDITERVDKIATIGTPWRGSCDAITKLVAGSGTLGNRSQASRERKMARLTPSLYYLLPNYENAVRGRMSDIFEDDGWQESVPRTIGEAIARVEGDKDETIILRKGKEILRQYLKDAKEYRKRIDEWKIDKNKILVIAGVGEHTLTSVLVTKEDDGSDSRFAFLGKDERIGDGDGTVPAKSSIPPFVDQIKPPVVCVSLEDFGIHEMRDRGLVTLTGLHEFMPRMNLVIRLLVRFFSGKQHDIHNNTWGRRHPEAEDWNLPFSLEQRRRKWKLPYARP